MEFEAESNAGGVDQWLVISGWWSVSKGATNTASKQSGVARDQLRRGET